MNKQRNIKLSLIVSLIIYSLILSCTTYRFDHIRNYEANKDELSLIKAMTMSKDAYIRAQAAQSLGRLKSAKALTPLIRMLEDKDWAVRYYSSWSLGKIRDKKAIEPLKKLLKKEEELHVIKVIKEALKNIG